MSVGSWNAEGEEHQGGQAQEGDQVILQPITQVFFIFDFCPVFAAAVNAGLRSKDRLFTLDRGAKAMFSFCIR